MNENFRLKINDVFWIEGRGTVATGIVLSGQIHVVDGVVVRKKDGSEIRAIITGIEHNRNLIEEAEAGMNVGLLLRGVKSEEVSMGDDIFSEKEFDSINRQFCENSSLTVQNDQFQMSIEDVFWIEGRGVVATGVISSGWIHVTDRVIIRKKDRSISKAVIIGIEFQKRLLDIAQEGMNVGLLLRGIAKGEIAKGDEIIYAET